MGNDGEFVPYVMWDNANNFGDAINPHIISSVAKKQVYRARGSGQSIVAIGSVLHKASDATLVWGTGLMFPDMDLSLRTDENIFAVRGELTKQALKSRGVLKKNISLGDPGYLVAKFWPKKDRTTPHKRPRIGLIPHHAQYDAVAFDSLKNSDRFDVVTLDFRTHNMRILEEIMMCDIIISQSLHGLIFAESYGIPNLWISSTDEAAWKFKFLDWYSTCADPRLEPFLFDKEVSLPIEAMAQEARLHNCQIDAERLISSFPHGRALVSFEGEDIIDFKECRRKEFLLVNSPKLTKLQELRTSSEIEAIAKISSWVRNDVKRRFRNWAEPRYCVYGSQASAVNRADLEKIGRFMNKRTKLSCVYISKQAEGVSAQRLKLDDYSGLRFLPGREGEREGVVVIRPNGSLDLNSSTPVTVFI